MQKMSLTNMRNEKGGKIMSAKKILKHILFLAFISILSLGLLSCTVSEKKSGGEKSTLSTPEETIRAATYVGSTKCLSCHGDKENWGKTLHKAVLRAPGAFSSAQSKAQTLYSSTINAGLTALTGGQTIYFDLSGTTWTANTSSGANTKFWTKIFSPTDSSNPVSGQYTFQITDGTNTNNYKVLFTYGGEKNYKQRYAVIIGRSKYVSPIQYNDKGVSGTDQWVPYHPERWWDSTGSAIKAPTLANGGFKDAFDGNCAGCHFTGLSVQNIAGQEVADAVDDPNGAVDFDGDGTMDEINIGCERCHGPGSQHVATLNPAFITNPEDLTAAKADMVCGQCHLRGKSKDTFSVFAEGTAKAPFPAKQDSSGNIQTYVVGFDDVNDYYQWDDGTGTFDNQYWGGEPSGGKFQTSYQHHQQYIDILQGPHAPNKSYDPRCFHCHDMHDNRSSGGHQIATSVVRNGNTFKTNNDDDTLCLACHATHGPFDTLTVAEVQDAGNGVISDNLKDVVTGHTQHDFDPTGDGASRCSKCHNPKTAKSARWDPTNADFGDSGTGSVTIRKGDIHAHTFNIIEPKYSKTDGTARGSGTKSGTESINNACTSCHYPSDGKIAAIDSLNGDAYLDGLQQEMKPTLTVATVTTAPTVDGAGTDVAWSSATALTLLAGDGMTTLDCVKCHSHQGTTQSVTLKAVKDSTNIYFLVSWADSDASLTRGGWEYTGDATTASWQAVSGQSEDRVGFFFPIGTIAGTFPGQTCMAKCHTTDISGVNGLEDEVFLTTGKADMWQMKANRSLGVTSGQILSALTVNGTTHEVTAGSFELIGFIDDKYVGQFDATNDVDGGRFGDSGSKTYFSRNRNSAQDAPLYIETGTNPADYVDAMFITQAEIDSGEAVLVSGLSAAQQNTAWGVYNAFGAVPPERLVDDPAGSRGDVVQAAHWTNGTWTTEIKRALNTGNSDDVVFSTGTHTFGIALMDNGGGDSHKPTRDIRLVIP